MRKKNIKTDRDICNLKHHPLTCDLVYINNVRINDCKVSQYQTKKAPMTLDTMELNLLYV